MSLSLRIGLGVGVALVLLTFAAYVSLLRLNVLPRLAFAPGWSLEDADGERITSEDLRGTIAVYAFDYTSNPKPGRRTFETMRGIQDALKAEDLGDIPVRLVTISLDPSRDTPDALRQIRSELHADSSRWIFATGDSVAIRTTVNYGFGVYYEPSDDGQISFDPTFLIVDGLGIERARYRFGLPEATDVVQDLLSIVREAQASTGSARLAYEAAHLFSCYAPPSG